MTTSRTAIRVGFFVFAADADDGNRALKSNRTAVEVGRDAGGGGEDADDDDSLVPCDDGDEGEGYETVPLEKKNKATRFDSTREGGREGIRFRFYHSTG